ncbi:MAG TPA: metal-dependent transcriptional regulator [Phycisphaerae bacterium]|nr:metal-dependent transcriptional regulator [Phycisphaerae bacterium]
MASRTIENYLKQLYLEQEAVPGEVAMGRLATIMSVVPGTATAMVKALADARLVHYSPRAGVRLTEAGKQLALHVLRRHRLVELLLVKVLGLDWSEVHEEAEELEHVISDKLLDRIDALLGYPEVDPHGDPIPTAGGGVQAVSAETLVSCPLGIRVRIARVLDQEPRFLQFVEASGLVPGARVEVAERDAQADAVRVVLARGGEQTLSTAAAGKFQVRAEGAESMEAPAGASLAEEAPAHHF